jgi:hypothetical protein
MIKRESCRVCNSELIPILDLGEQYVSDFIDPDQSPGIKAPLELGICKKCKLVSCCTLFQVSIYIEILV